MMKTHKHLTVQLQPGHTDGSHILMEEAGDEEVRKQKLIYVCMQALCLTLFKPSGRRRQSRRSAVHRCGPTSPNIPHPTRCPLRPGM